MEIIASLIKEFPFGSFIIILAALWAFERMVTSFINRNKPIVQCDCNCCEEEEEDCCEEDEEDED